MSLEQDLYQYSELPRQNCIRLLSLTIGDDDTLHGHLELANIGDWQLGSHSDQHAGPCHEIAAKKSRVRRGGHTEPRHGGYITLSYTWGNADESQEQSDKVKLHDRLVSSRRLILLDGKHLSITENLFNVLKQVCKMECYRTRLFWIDAICIDQNNADEKGSQVANMGSIYRNAQSVLIWLGEADSNSNLAVALLESLVGKYSVLPRFPQRIYTGVNDPALWTHLHIERPSMQQWKAGAAILSRAWFFRVWVVQELVLSAGAVFLLGDHIMEEESLLAFCSLLYSTGWWWSVFESFGKNSQGCTNFLNMMKIHQEGFADTKGSAVALGASETQVTLDRVCTRALETVNRCRRFQATDPRDKILAISELVKGPFLNDENVRVAALVLPKSSYRVRPKVVYTKFTRNIITYGRSINILSMVGSNRNAALDLPSWVPDFSVGPNNPPFDYSRGNYNATANWHASSPMFEEGSEAMIIEAVRFDRVELVSTKSMSIDSVSKIQGSQHSLEAIWLTWEMWKKGTSKDPLLTLMTVLASFWFQRRSAKPMSLHSDQFFDAFEAWLMVPAVRAFVEAKTSSENKSVSMQQFLFDDSFMTMAGRVIDTNAWCALYKHDRDKIDCHQGVRDLYNERFEDGRFKFQANAGSAFKDRRLILTEKYGRLGLAPLGTLSSDEVWFLRGGKVPYILRADEDDDTYTFLGECYVDGFMHGEIFAGATGISIDDAVKIHIV